MQKRGMIFAAALLALLLALFLRPAALAEGVAINDTNFPDANFRAYVKGEFDKNGDNFLSVEEIEAAESISVAFGRDKIADLTGIEHLRR